MQNFRLLLELGKPRIMALMCLLTLAGAALSPHFLSPDFPPTRLAGAAFFVLMARLFPRVFSPVGWSIAHALGAAVVVGLLWLGTAVVNDLADQSIDSITSPERPIPSHRIGQPLALRWAFGFQALALGLTLLDGSLAAIGLTAVGIFLGNSYSLPPLRLRRSGLAANLIIGAGVAFAALGGELAQGGLTEPGLFSALALGLLATSASMVKDFKDVAGDRAAGVRTVPVRLGFGTAVLVNMGAVAVSYVLAMLLLVQHIGLVRWVLELFLGLGALNLVNLISLLHGSGFAGAAAAHRRAIIIFMGMKVRKLQPGSVPLAL